VRTHSSHTPILLNFESPPAKPKELESLAEAVRLETRRLRAYEAQRRLVWPYHHGDTLTTAFQGRALIRGTVFYERS
jgi:hypothetical protein